MRENGYSINDWEFEDCEKWLRDLATDNCLYFSEQQQVDISLKLHFSRDINCIEYKVNM